MGEKEKHREGMVCFVRLEKAQAVADALIAAGVESVEITTFADDDHTVSWLTACSGGWEIEIARRVSENWRPAGMQAKS